MKATFITQQEKPTEMEKLIMMLFINGIHVEVGQNRLTETLQVWYPSRANQVCDVICHKYSFGGTKGYLEIMGLTKNEDGVEGWLTAYEVFCRIYEHHCATQ